MKPNPACIHFIPLSLALGALACNLGTSIAGPTPTPEETQAPSADTPAPPAASPTPFDPASFPTVSGMGRLSPAQGWAQTTNRLLWTEDAGQSWRDITPPDLPDCLGEIGCPTSVDRPFFLDAAQIWLPVLEGRQDVPPTTLTVFYTRDGGREWSRYTVAEIPEPGFCPGPACLSGIDLDFVDAQTGWLAAHAPLGNIGDRQYLYRTGDGGRSWVPLAIPVSGTISFLDASTGWAAGGATRWSSDQLLRTRDGGDSWQDAGLVFPEPYVESIGPEYSWYQQPVFFSGGSGVLPVRFNQPQGAGMAIGFYTTLDGGERWSLAAMLQDQEMQQAGELFPIAWSAIDPSTWYVFVSPDRQYRTRDGGLTWETFPAAGLGGASLVQVRLVSEAEGWGLGLICTAESGCHQPLFATHDGGRTWAPVAPGP